MKQSLQMTSFPLKRIYPGLPLPGNLYLFLDGHFIKIINTNDSLSKEKFEQFITMKLQYVFVESSDQDKFANWHQSERQKEKDIILNNIDEKNKKSEQVIEKHLSIKEEVLEFLTSEVSETSVQNLLTKTRSFVDDIRSNQGTSEKYLSKIMCYSQSIGDHCTNVANLSVYLALSLGYDQQTILENIYVGALLHDYGKVVVNLNSINPLKNPQHYLTELRRHPEVGRVTLLLESGVPEESILIIQEHHERHDGKGYPKEITGNKIYALTKIVSIANQFDNIACDADDADTIQERQTIAYNEISKDKGQLFDPAVLKKCLNSLRPVIFGT